MGERNLPVAEIRDLHVTLHRDGVAGDVLRGIDLEIAPREILALVGESGCGKSTLAMALQGLLPAEAEPVLRGSIRVAGTEVVGASDDDLRALRRASLGAVFQDPSSSLDPTMRVGKQLDEAIRDGATPESWLATVGIPDPDTSVRSFPHQLSGGQRQRAMIAMAMADRPALVVADEPTTALDVTVQAAILELFRELREDFSTAMLFVTHDLAVAGSIADRIAVMYAGRIVEQGPVREVIGAPRHPYTVGLMTARLELEIPKNRQLPVLAGEPPVRPDDDLGCAFLPRCPIGDDVCTQAVPVHVDGGRSVACHHVDRVHADLWQRRSEDWPPTTTPEEREPAIAIEDVAVRYRGRRRKDRQVLALDHVSLRVEPAEAVAVVGESGSGKSTLLRLSAGLIKPDEGTVHTGGDGRPQMVYQDASSSLTPWLTVGEMVGERLRAGDLSRADQRERVGEALATVGLSPAVAEAKPAALSGGQRQRVAIARAIVIPPPLLLCDEPTSALDVSLAASILNLLGVLRRRFGMGLLFVTHDLAAARFVADRIVVLRQGEVVEHGPTDRIVESPQHPYTQELLASMPRALEGTA